MEESRVKKTDQKNRDSFLFNIDKTSSIERLEVTENLVTKSAQEHVVIVGLSY